MSELNYWDVFPQSIRFSKSDEMQFIPLSMRGSARSVEFESSNPAVAEVFEDGVLAAGTEVGNAMIMVRDSENRNTLRYLQVEVRDPSWFANHPDYVLDLGENVTLQGSVIDALSTNAVAGVLITIRRNSGGSIVAQQITDSRGEYEVELYEGVYIYEATAQNYISSTGLISVAASGSIGQHIVMSPELNGQVARIVLQWGETPRDLDSHLRGPRPGGGSFHVSYSDDYVEDCGELDVDDTSSYGPETITMLRLVAGTYLYSVHDYTNRNSSTSTGLANSNATVKLFFHDGQELTFNVPDQPGTLWNVFEIDGATGVITPLNEMEFESNI
ncbi:hypothetical protein P4E94_02095 [Pontiellaceae bacterium B12219]|nr:hypothetical protein [Pontiellaceae bacterium B12219]